MTDVYIYIREQIKKLRGDMSQEAMAKALGIATNTLSRWETGKYKPDAADLDNMARVFKVTISSFFPEDQDIATERVKALTSALGGLEDDDFKEVINYAQYRKTHLTLKDSASKKKRKQA